MSTCLRCPTEPRWRTEAGVRPSLAGATAASWGPVSSARFSGHTFCAGP